MCVLLLEKERERHSEKKVSVSHGIQYTSLHVSHTHSDEVNENSRRACVCVFERDQLCYCHAWRTSHEY